MLSRCPGHQNINWASLFSCPYRQQDIKLGDVIKLSHLEDIKLGVMLSCWPYHQVIPCYQDSKFRVLLSTPSIIDSQVGIIWISSSHYKVVQIDFHDTNFEEVEQVYWVDSVCLSILLATVLATVWDRIISINICWSNIPFWLIYYGMKFL